MLNYLKTKWGLAAAVAALAAVTVLAYSQYVRRLPVTRNESVLLLHGLCRSSLSMKMLEHDLRKAGYAVENIGYASTRKTITAVALQEVAAAVDRCRRQGYDQIHFVTHSLGGIVVRRFLEENHLPEGSRIVMLAPPNQGSELVDWALARFPRISRLAGPAFRQLTTADAPLMSALPPIAPQVGVIIGENSWNPFFSKILPGRDDGKVTVERAKLKEMQDFMVAPCNHTTITLDRQIRRQAAVFIEQGRFQQGGAGDTSRGMDTSRLPLPPMIADQPFLGYGGR